MKTRLSLLFLLLLAVPAALTAQTVTSVSCGQFHTLFVKSDGSLWAMGQNLNGELGNGTYDSTNVPQEIVPTGVVAVSAGGLHSLFLKSDGSLWAMGDNVNGQLGDGSFEGLAFKTNLPEMIVPGGVKAISAGLYHSLFLKTDGSLWAMGNGSAGELGAGPGNSYQNRPELIVSSGVAAISAGNAYSMFLKTDGTLWVMGYGTYGGLGDGSVAQPVFSPEMITNNVATICAAFDHALFIKNDGSLWDMGGDQNGQLGDGTNNNTSRPLNPFPGTGITGIAGGESYSLFLTNGNSLWGMGSSANGQLGDGTTTSIRSIPEQIVPGNVTMVSAGLFQTTMFVKSDGTLWGMGYNEDGELGDATANPSVLSPEQINLPSTPPIGAITVTINPPAVATNGAQWQLDGGTLYNSGDTATGLTLGAHTISYTDFTGYNTPSNQIVQTYPGFTTTTNVAYHIPDSIAPKLAITAPKSGIKVSNDVVTVSGTASDNNAVASVLLSVNGGFPDAAIISSNKWSDTLDLTPGTNIITAYALDENGNASPTNTIKVVYILTAHVVVNIVPAGTGILKPNDNGAALILNANYSMKAIPAKGYGFVDWNTGGTMSANPALTFNMVNGLVITANFKDIAPPTVVIKSPKANAKETNTTVTVTGTALDNLGVTAVGVQINTDDWVLADGTNNWSATLPVVRGANTIRVYAMDAAGNISKTNLIKITGNLPPDWAPGSISSSNMVVTPAGSYPIAASFDAATFSQTDSTTTNDSGTGAYTYQPTGTNTADLQLSFDAPLDMSNSLPQDIQLTFTAANQGTFLDTNSLATGSFALETASVLVPKTWIGHTITATNHDLSSITVVKVTNKTQLTVTAGGIPSTDSYVMTNASPNSTMFVVTEASGNVIYFQLTFTSTKGGNYEVNNYDSGGNFQGADFGTYTFK